MRRTDWQQAADASYDKVYRSLIAVGASPADAADALQDAFERALRVDEEVARPDGWLFVTALRRWRTQRWRSRLFAPLSVLRDRETTPPPGEDAVVLIAELKRLPPGERAAFVCRYVLGLSQRETADALGVAVGTVTAATTHAARKLRERLDANE
jgi:RNA polymerase sigma-70 factor (ECF subfamily)